MGRCDRQLRYALLCRQAKRRLFSCEEPRRKSTGEVSVTELEIERTTPRFFHASHPTNPQFGAGFNRVPSTTPLHLIQALARASGTSVSPLGDSPPSESYCGAIPPGCVSKLVRRAASCCAERMNSMMAPPDHERQPLSSLAGSALYTENRACRSAA